ncbi:serine/threonine-protein kinase [Nocardia australiensis]|uniref:serine/threonine-protein kinase n=1 Tax=Nocardia australiensis TaxID=2887191 RepID=UPI001D141ABB|nr:serine/threonine-protein kinase [Nocardia australiensis]
MLASGDVFAGYVIDRQLGRGGMGSVYLAKHPRLPRMTALKLLNREMFFDKEVRARFEREADLVAQLDHPSIVTVYDRGLDDEQLWISMQYIDGVDAASVDPESLPPERAVQIIKETADALDYAHGMGVLHRDVKPANILLARSGSGRGERVYLTDFGIARLRDDTGHLTQTGTFTATLAYASPEQLTGATLDNRSDQYSLACSLFWLFTGTGPFAATNPAAVIQSHLQSAPPALSSARPGMPYILDGVLARAMAKRPEDRYPTCSDFAAAARQALLNPSTPSMPVVGVPRPQTGPPIPVTGSPYWVANRPAPQTSGAAPLTGPPMTNPPSLTSMPQQPVQQPQRQTGPPQQQQPIANHPYNPQQGYGFNAPPPHLGGGQRPGQPPRPKSNTGLIIGICVGAVVLILVVLLVIGIVAGSDSTSNSGAASTSTSGSAGSITPNGDAISAAFPRMVPASESADTGYNGSHCIAADSTSPSPPTTGSPDFGKWVFEWDCYGGGESSKPDPFYTIFVFDSAADIQAVINALPTNTKSTDTNGGKTYTNYKYDNDGPKILTVFTGDPSRAQFLMYTDGLAGSIDKAMRWWRSAPLN